MNIASAISGSPSRVLPSSRKGTTNNAMAESLNTDNRAVADALERYASLLDLAGSSYYVVRAYRRAAELIRPLPTPVAELVRSGRVRELRGIGPGLEARLRELVETGRDRARARARVGGRAGARRPRAVPRPLAEARRRGRARAQRAHRGGAARGGRERAAPGRPGDGAEDGREAARGARARGRAARAARPDS